MKLALCVSSLVAICDSCQKTDTDEFVPHADVAFTLKITETRQSHEFVWHLDSGQLYCPEQKLSELWITAWNSCILEASSDDPDFDGVNFSSSLGSAVGVEKIDEKSCRLVYRSDCADRITITASTDNLSQSFQLSTKECIELEHVLVRLGDREYMLDVREQEYSELVLFEPAIDDIWSHPTGGELFTVIDIIPENASFRELKAWGSTRFLDIDPELNKNYGPWPTYADEINLDWSQVKDRQFWYSPDAETYLFRAEFKAKGHDRNGRLTDKVLYASLWGRYMWTKEVRHSI